MTAWPLQARQGKIKRRYRAVTRWRGVQEGVVPVKLPLQVVLPLASAVVGAAIAVGIGLANLALADAFSHTEPVIFAAALMTIIMAVAAYLSSKNPDPEDADEIQSRH